MKKLLFAIIPLLLLCISCKKEEIYALDHKEDPYLYWVSYQDCGIPGGGYVTFERYMWDVGFPDSIIVAVTRNGKFLGYDKAKRRGVLKDSHGSSYSPAYKIVGVNGDALVYDLKGNFVRFDRCFGNDQENKPYEEWKP